jgi:AraC-like DNA-binding protein
MPFTFSAYSSLLLPFFVQGVVVSAVLLLRRRQHGSPADGWLALLLLLSTARLAQWMLGFAGWYDSHDAYSTFMFYFPFSNWLAVGPALYFYFRSLTNQEFRFRRRDWWHFAPALLYLGGRLLLWAYDIGWQHLARGQSLPAHFGTKGRLAAALDNSYLGALPEDLGYLLAVVYAVVTLRAYRRYRRYLDDNFSDTERIRFGWLRNVLWAIPAGLVVTLLFELVDATIQPLDYYQVWYDYFFTGVLSYYLGLAGLLANHRLTAPLHFQPAAPEAPPAVALPALPGAPDDDPAVEAGEPARSGPAPVHAAGAVVLPAPGPPLPAAGLAADLDPELRCWTERLRAHMAAARPYLAPELTLGELAAQLRTNPTWLSRVINSGCGQNFNDFVNEYRVRAAEQKLNDPKLDHYTLLAIALEAGFNSKSTFNRVFRKLRGKTPSEAALRLKSQGRTSQIIN